MQARSSPGLSDISTTDGDVNVEGTNSAHIVARNQSAMSSDGLAIGVTLAFNTVGYQAQNVLFAAIDALVGTNLGDAQPAAMRATVTDSDIRAAGSVTVKADNQAYINAYLSNDTSSEAAAATGNDSGETSGSSTGGTAGGTAGSASKTAAPKPKGLALGFVLASNMVSSLADAHISGAGRNVSTEAGSLTVAASDDARITSKTSLSAVAKGEESEASLALKALVNHVGISYTDRSGERKLKIGDRVLVADVNFDTADQPDAVTAGQRVLLKTSVGGGAAGDVYEYVGDTDLETPAFDDQNFKNTSLWKAVQGKAGKTYVYKGSGRSADLASENFNATGNWLLIDLGQLADIGYGLAAALTASDDGAAAFGGLVVRNDLRSDVQSSVQDQTLEIGGDVSVTAQENAAIVAIDISTVAAKDLGLNLVIATNTVLGSSLAWIANSDVTTTSISSPTQAIAGNLTVSSDSKALISAELTSKVEASVSVGIVLAFNTIGYAPQDLLRNVVDGVLGIGLAGEQKAATKAWIVNSPLNLGGALSVTADWAGSINAVVNNSALAITVSSAENSKDSGSKNAISVAPVVAMNKISADVAAYVDAGALGKSVSALGDITIEAHGSTRINAEVAASAVAIAVSSKAAARAVSVGLSLSRNDVSSDVKAYAAGASAAARPTLTSEQGSIRIGVWRESQIIANGTASAIAVAASPSGGPAVGGAGTMAFNRISGSADAYAERAHRQRDARATGLPVHR